MSKAAAGIAEKRGGVCAAGPSILLAADKTRRSGRRVTERARGNRESLIREREREGEKERDSSSSSSSSKTRSLTRLESSQAEEHRSSSRHPAITVRSQQVWPLGDHFFPSLSAAALCSFSSRSTMGCVANSTGTEVLLQLEALRSAAQLSQLFRLTEKKKVRLE